MKKYAVIAITMETAVWQATFYPHERVIMRMFSFLFPHILRLYIQTKI